MVFERLNFRQNGQLDSKKKTTNLVDKLKEIKYTYNDNQIMNAIIGDEFVFYHPYKAISE